MKYCKVSFRGAVLRLITLILLTIFAVTLTLSVGAETLEGEIISLDAPANISVVVAYSGNEPELTFVSPSGELFSERLTPDDLNVVRGDHAINFQIPDADAGSWKMRYDSAFSGKLEVTVTTYTRDLLISAFDITELSEYNAETAFFVEFPRDVTFNYIIRAVLTDSDGIVTGYKELQTGSAQTNQEESRRVSLDTLQSYSSYRLELEAYLNDYGIEVNDKKLSRMFSHDNPSSMGELGDFKLTLNVLSGDLDIDWTEVAPYRTDAYILAVFDDNNKDEPLYTNVFDSDDEIGQSLATATSVDVDGTVNEIRVELSYRYRNTVSPIHTMTIHPNENRFTFLTEAMTSSATATVSYEITHGITLPVTLSISSQEPKTMNLSGSDKISFPIPEYESTVSLSYQPSETVSLVYSKVIDSDRTPPSLVFYENLTAVTTSDASFLLVGMTDGNAIFTINGTAQSIQPDGSFSVSLSLSDGENIFEIISADPCGNQTLRTLVIRKSITAQPSATAITASFPYFPLIITAVLSLVFALLVLLLFRNKKAKPSAGKILVSCTVMSWILTAISMGGTVWVWFLKSRGEVVNTAEFFDLVRTSLTDAYELLVSYTRHSAIFRIGFAVTLVLLGISIIFTVLLCLFKSGKFQHHKFKKNKSEKAEAVKTQTPLEKSHSPVSPEPDQKSAATPQKSETPVKEPGNPETSKSVSPDKPVSVRRFCPQCGHKCGSDEVFCISCGFKLK